MSLEILPLLCAFENTSNCIEISFGSDSFVEKSTHLLQKNVMEGSETRTTRQHESPPALNSYCCGALGNLIETSRFVSI